jgi:arabinogalactan oligomer/maltooligosaccharide transport system substrate-binding protein
MLMESQMKIVWFLFFLLPIVGCQTAAPDDELSGRITLWHSWSEDNTIVLKEALAEYEEIHPNVRVVAVTLPRDQILDEFKKAGRDGLGPALLIGNNSWIGELVIDGLIRPLSIDEKTISNVTSRNKGLTSYQNELYGVALSLSPNALYYNKNLVTEPPETLDELLQDAANGNRVAFVPRFEEAYWGIQAFGEGLFDDQGKFTLAESGFKQWLSWLEEAQHAPGVILNVDNESLFDLFTSGQVAYYIAGPEIQKRLPADTEGQILFDYGVAPLPDGPQGAAGSLLPAETIFLYSYTSPEQTRIANNLTAFLVNQQQGIRFMRELNRVPANPSVAVDRRIYPIVHGFAQQVESAVVIPNEIQSQPLITAGNRTYVSVLSGALSPTEAVCQFGLEVAAFQGYTTADMNLPQNCEVPPEVRNEE